MLLAAQIWGSIPVFSFTFNNNSFSCAVSCCFSLCARSEGQMKMYPEAAKDPNSRLRKARRKWEC